MRLLKKNIGVYILVGVFLQPHIFNNLHFVLVSHEYHFEFKHSEKTSFQSKIEYHNCEQYLFKVPPTIEINLFETKSIVQHFQFKEISENEIKILIQNLYDAYPKRGPPELFLNT